jgi:S-DNA-T family DNA segregation ATPase FtsK/SpoIIIE
MERRYALIKQANVRNIKDYNRYVAETGDGETLPKIVIIIDELADLMLSAKDAVETSIARLAAKARAAGIHLLIGTQRPSVDVITGTIKSNIPSRIAFHVSSQVDSRTILDSAGAEKLLPHGDMLFMDAGKEPQRVQGAFVDDKEIVRVVEFLKANNEADTARGEEIMADIEREAEKCVPQKKSDSDEDYSGGGSNIPTDDDDNHLLWAALQVGFDFKKISTSLLQRKLSIGYGKAAKILDALEDQGYISAQDGSKPREILISYEEFKEMMARGVHEQTNGNF